MLEKPLYGQSRADDKYKDGFANIVDDYIWNNWKLPKKQGGGNLNIQEWNGIIMRIPILSATRWSQGQFKNALVKMEA